MRLVDESVVLYLKGLASADDAKVDEGWDVYTAFEEGMQEGYTILARDILDKMGVAHEHSRED